MARKDLRPLEKRSRDKYCRFHQDHGYNYFDLKEQIEALIQHG